MYTRPFGNFFMAGCLFSTVTPNMLEIFIKNLNILMNIIIICFCVGGFLYPLKWLKLGVGRSAYVRGRKEECEVRGEGEVIMGI